MSTFSFLGMLLIESLCIDAAALPFANHAVDGDRSSAGVLALLVRATAGTVLWNN